MKNTMLSITVFAVTYLVLQAIPRDPAVIETPATQEVTRQSSAIEVPSFELHMIDIEDVDVTSQSERPIARLDFNHN